MIRGAIGVLWVAPVFKCGDLSRRRSAHVEDVGATAEVVLGQREITRAGIVKEAKVAAEQPERVRRRCQGIGGDTCRRTWDDDCAGFPRCIQGLEQSPIANLVLTERDVALTGQAERGGPANAPSAVTAPVPSVVTYCSSCRLALLLMVSAQVP